MNNKYIIFLFFLFLAMTLFFISCGPKEDSVERIIEDGVEVVINRLEPHTIKGEPGIPPKKRTL